VAVFAIVGAARTLAQTTLPAPDPFAPKLESDPRQPPTFRKAPPQARPGAPTRFATIPPGTGLTGFDATNARTKLRETPTAKALNRPLPPDDRKAQTARNAPDDRVSPYQLPVPPLSSSATNAAISPNSALAIAPGSPGAPPVDIGPIRKPPPKRKAAS